MMEEDEVKEKGVEELGNTEKTKGAATLSGASHFVSP